jgi:hypothetical protein
METQRMQEVQEVHRKISPDGKTTKERLNELKDLKDGGYITELEFKIARVNVLKEGEIDVVIRQHHSQWFSSHGKKAPRGRGYIFFPAILLLTLFALGVFFAASYWPDRFGELASFIQISQTAFSGGGNQEEQEEYSDAARNDTRNDISYNMPEDRESDIEAHVQTVAPLFTSLLPSTEPETSFFVESNVVPETNPLPVNADITSEIDSSAAVAAITPAPGVTVMEIVPSITAPPNSGRTRGYVSASSVRIRSAPSTSSNNVLGVAHRGERFTLLEIGTGGATGWYYVLYDNGRRGWTSVSLLTLEN